MDTPESCYRKTTKIYKLIRFHILPPGFLDVVVVDLSGKRLLADNFALLQLEAFDHCPTRSRQVVARVEASLGYNFRFKVSN